MGKIPDETRRTGLDKMEQVWLAGFPAQGLFAAGCLFVYNA
jgi:hypothetical protein